MYILPDSVSAWFDSNYLPMGIGILIIPTILLLIMSIAFALKGIRKSGEISDGEGLSLKRTQMILYSILSFVFCADFVVSIICYKRARNNNS